MGLKSHVRMVGKGKLTREKNERREKLKVKTEKVGIIGMEKLTRMKCPE